MNTLLLIFSIVFFISVIGIQLVCDYSRWKESEQKRKDFENEIRRRFDDDGK